MALTLGVRDDDFPLRGSEIPGACTFALPSRWCLSCCVPGCALHCFPFRECPQVGKSFQRIVPSLRDRVFQRAAGFLRALHGRAGLQHSGLATHLTSSFVPFALY